MKPMMTSLRRLYVFQIPMKEKLLWSWMILTKSLVYQILIGIIKLVKQHLKKDVELISNESEFIVIIPRK